MIYKHDFIPTNLPDKRIGRIKEMDLSNVHQNRLNAVAKRLNERPRETLNYETPTERFSQCVASIG
jgi:IS30 family transposase